MNLQSFRGGREARKGMKDPDHLATSEVGFDDEAFPYFDGWMRGGARKEYADTINQRERVGATGFFAFLVATTIGFGSVNQASLVVVPVLRGLALCLAIVCLILRLLQSGRPPALLSTVAVITALYCYGVLQATAEAKNLVDLRSIALSYVLVSWGALLFASCSGASCQLQVARYFICFASLWLLFLVLTGGVELGGMPSYHFDIEDDEGRVVSYSQGISKYFGIASVFALYYAKSQLTNILSIFFIGIALAFLFFSFIGGGRGDFLVALLIILIMAAKSGRRIWLPLVIVIITCVSLLLVWAIEESIGEILMVQRLQVLIAGESLGLRDQLVLEGLELLGNKLDCLAMGCGYGFFQTYFSYEYGMYPHNIVVESVIVWGLPIVIGIASLAFIGWKSLRWQGGALHWVGAYMLLIGLKSGDVVNSWLAMSYILYLAGQGLSMRRV